MSKELVIGSNRHETKVAVLEDDQLVEVYFQRANEYSLAGSIHKGRVTRVLPGMQSAFVDLGLERDTFLYVSDFFEEHEDFEPLGDDKPAVRDRRDRRPNRSGERPTEGRVAQPREARPLIIESAAAEQVPAERAIPEPIEVPEDETEVPAADFKPVVADAPGNGQGDRTEIDRGFRGDRRGRRSRRKRQRGRGFPENKYAQPISSPPASEAPRTVPLPEQPQNASDVIMLPGESLAKYRHVSSASETSERSEADDRETTIPSPESENDVAEEEAIEAEAEEIELAEKVLAHHDDESPADVEEKIEEVKQDQPIPPPPEETASSEIPEAPATEIPDDEALDVDEFEPADLEDTLPDSDVEDDASEPGEPVLNEGGEPVLEQPGEPREGTETPRTQTAFVREQGPYMHRVSRRMRRRRGGNRFSSQNQEFGGNEPVGAATAAAPALEPAARADQRKDEQEERSGERPERLTPSIADLLKAGQEIIVQIAKEPLGQKGARITSHVALPGRFVVFMPSVDHLGVSRKVASEEERQRLKRILQTHRVGTTGGFIVRTAGEGVSKEEIAADMNFLYTLWLDIRQKAEKKPAPALLHYDLDIVQRILRDQVTDEFKAIWVDNEEMYENTLNFMQRFQPALVHRVKLYTRSAPIFDAFNITQELEKALRPKVWLKSGGYIVINQTEALVAIDINTGKYVGKSNRLEDTIVKTNTEAIKEIVRQIRLRDLGGIIVVDFIDMDERKNRQKVMQALEEAMRADKAPYKILQFNDFGLVAITRKRVKQSLERTLCSPCPYCEGAGYVKSVQTILSEILVEAQKIARAIEGKDVVLRVHPDVAKVLKASNNQYLEELEDILGRPVLVKGDLTLHHEKFDLV